MIGFMGLGKLGLPVALACESLGQKVLACDVSPKVNMIVSMRQCPYSEEGVQDLLAVSDIELCSVGDLVGNCQIIFIAVQTPHRPEYEGITELPRDRVDFDCSFLERAAREVSSEILKQGKRVVVSVVSTVLPGTINARIGPLFDDGVSVCYNPLFIAMGTAVKDFLDPEFVLIGSDTPEHADTLVSLYESITSAPIHTTTIRNAEVIKVAYNTFISTKIAFANTLMEVCHKIGGDVDDVVEALSMGTRRLLSRRYLSGGMGDGGACHPRDNIAMSHLARELSLSYDWFENVMRARECHTMWLANLMEGFDLPKVVLGKAFKAESSLVDGSCAVLLANILRGRGHEVAAYDPLIDSGCPQFGASVFLIGTKHAAFARFPFPDGSVVIDPWRYIEDRPGVTVIRVGGQ